MKKTKLLFIIGLLATSLTSFISCSPKQAVDETKQKVEEGYDKAKEKVKEGVDNIFNDDEAKFNLTSLKDDLKAKGFEEYQARNVLVFDGKLSRSGLTRILNFLNSKGVVTKNEVQQLIDFDNFYY